jgi:hypothetical protein
MSRVRLFGNRNTDFGGGSVSQPSVILSYPTMSVTSDSRADDEVFVLHFKFCKYSITVALFRRASERLHFCREPFDDDRIGIRSVEWSDVFFGYSNFNCVPSPEESRCLSTFLSVRCLKRNAETADFCSIRKGFFLKLDFIFFQNFSLFADNVDAGHT